MQIVAPMWEEYTAANMALMFKKERVKHYGWPEIIVHDQGNEFMGKAFQNMCSEQGIMTVPIDSQSPWHPLGKMEKRNVQEVWSNSVCGT